LELHDALSNVGANLQVQQRLKHLKQMEYANPGLSQIGDLFNSFRQQRQKELNTAKDPEEGGPTKRFKSDQQ
jgi:hypothetical protein